MCIADGRPNSATFTRVIPLRVCPSKGKPNGRSGRSRRKSSSGGAAAKKAKAERGRRGRETSTAGDVRFESRIVVPAFHHSVRSEERESSSSTANGAELNGSSCAVLPLYTLSFRPLADPGVYLK